MTERTLTIDPDGSWRRQRYEFCNALEAVLDDDDDKAWALLERMGVKRVPAKAEQEAGK